MFTETLLQNLKKRKLPQPLRLKPFRPIRPQIEEVSSYNPSELLVSGLLCARHCVCEQNQPAEPQRHYQSSVSLKPSLLADGSYGKGSS